MARISDKFRSQPHAPGTVVKFTCGTVGALRSSSISKEYMGSNRRACIRRTLAGVTLGMSSELAYLPTLTRPLHFHSAAEIGVACTGKGNANPASARR